VRDSQEKIQLQGGQAILEILFADTHFKSGVEASDDEDYFVEIVGAQKMFWDWIRHNKH
jgi:NADPH-dependent ferric siderophore reductase